MISGISKIVVPVDDQVRAKEFWTSRLGFDVVSDESYGDERWIEVSPPAGGPVIVLSPRKAVDAPREVPDQLPHSPVFFTCDDIEATHRELVERGVRFPVPPGQDALRLVVAVRGRRRHALRARAVGLRQGMSERDGYEHGVPCGIAGAYPRPGRRGALLRRAVRLAGRGNRRRPSDLPSARA